MDRKSTFPDDVEHGQNTFSGYCLRDKFEIDSVRGSESRPCLNGGRNELPAYNSPGHYLSYIQSRDVNCSAAIISLYNVLDTDQCLFP